MLVNEALDVFWASSAALRTFDDSDGVNFHTFPLPEYRCVRFFLKNFVHRVPEPEISEAPEALHTLVQPVMQRRSRRRDQDTEKYRPLIPHSIVSVARGPEFTRVG